jgi:two-component system alkaline phosphatase synthesis response regulator PhoP
MDSLWGQVDMKILLVDDDPENLALLGRYLSREGYEIMEARDGRTALVLAAEARLVVLDLMLPELSGWNVAKALRHELPELPILMLTALGSEDDKVHGLELGADDYVVKPFSPRELVARVKALLRRVGLPSGLHHGELLIFPESREAFYGPEPLPLTRLEFDLLLTLAQHPGLVWSRERLLERVWGLDFPGTTRTVDVRVAALRKKLGDEAEEHGRYIETVHGVGYRFRDA